MTKYTPWLEPIRTDFERLSWREAEAFLQEFVRRVPERVRMLEVLVGQAPGFEDWRADRSEESFRRLGPWVLSSLERRELGREEKHLEVLNPHLEEWMIRDLEQRVKDEPMWEFTPLSEAILVDIGAYMGDSLHTAFPTTRWIRCRRRGDIRFNGPLLGMVKDWGFSPLVVPHNIASNICKKPTDVNRFFDTHAFWAEDARASEPRRPREWMERK